MQSLVVRAVLSLCKMMPIDVASSIGGFIGRNLLIFTGWTKIAKKNLRLVYPDISNKEVNVIIKKMWNNIGRVAGEYVHLESIVDDCGIGDESKRINVKGVENVKDLMGTGKSIFFLGAHMSNWEVTRVFERLFPEEKLGCVYRKPNNPYVRNILNKMRKDNEYILYSNRADGMKAMTRDIKRGINVGLLVDQWLSSGAKTNFLGRETKAPGMYTKFAKKYGSPLVPFEFRRLDGKCKFELVFGKEIKVSEKDSDEVIVQRVSDELTQYIKANPESWLWIHNRFK